MAQQVMEIIKKRRSVRRYKPEQIPDDKLHEIIEAGRFAPSGGNNQQNHFMVIQSEAVLNDLKRIVVEEFAKMEVSEDTYKSLKSAILQAKNGTYDFVYKAPTLVVLANRRGYGNAMADCAVALQNMMLAAVSVGIGSCWINQLAWLTDNATVRSYMAKLGLLETEVICGGLILGYSDQNEMPPLERKGNQVTYIK